MPSEAPLSPSPALASLLLSLLPAALGASPSVVRPQVPAVDFARDVRPILAERCIECHGPDDFTRPTDLRLDTRAGLFADLGGYAAVVPGEPEESELFLRITSELADERMPPPDAGPPLSAPERERIEAWIRAGAPWERHWSFQPPRRPAPPEEVDDPWCRAPIDGFVLRGLRDAGLEPAPEADPLTLLRRLSFDLIGLPPTPEEVAEFAQEPDRELAFDRAVDRLFASPHFGERMAIEWLDLVRYADSTGYHGDNERQVHLYRDYVIRSFNRNKPFDEFTIEQLAGDLLEEPNREQLVASGYNRLIKTTVEAGAKDGEYLARYAADRVRNLSGVWLGLTMGCAECHDHKYDPLSTKEFYELEAFFADIREEGVGIPKEVPFPSKEQVAEFARLRSERAQAEALLAAAAAELEEERRAWEESVLADVRSPGFRAGPWFASAARTSSEGPSSDPADALQAPGANWEARPEWQEGTPAIVAQPREAAWLRREIEATKATTLYLRIRANAILHAWLDGAEVPVRELGPLAPSGDSLDAGKPFSAAETYAFSIEVELSRGSHELVLLAEAGPHPAEMAVRLRATTVPEEVLAALATAPLERSSGASAAIEAHYRTAAPELEELRAARDAWDRRIEELKAAVPRTLITQSGPPRPTRVLPGGNWLDDSGELVEPDVPAALPPLEARGERADRLDLARWLVADGHPLTSRVLANRLWRMCFGRGLSATPDDLGTRGDLPSHPELLDWLALELVESGWDVKALLRTIVGSSTYRQASTWPGMLEPVAARDPRTRLFGRQGTFRLPAELVRDNALAVSGLIDPTIGGPSAWPYQPEGHWAQMNFPPRNYAASAGPAQYRRGVYTHWQRTFLHPSLAAFDAPSREECTAERVRSTTPTQALVLLNDPTYVEAARALAQEVSQYAGEDAERGITWAFRRVLGRAPHARELQVLARLFDEHFEALQAEEPEAVRALLSVGQAQVPEQADQTLLAAWVSVARVLLNLYETNTRA